MKDLLQLGFSFFVAGYLLVQTTRVVSELVHLVRMQGELLGTVVATLARMEDLLHFLAVGGAPARGAGGE